MEASVKDIYKVIPDFDAFLKLTDEIGELSYKKLVADKDIKRAEANVVIECTTNTKYALGGKPPSMTFIDSTYKFTGIDGEILPLRETYAEVSATLEKRKLELSVYKDMLEVWRTLSANERNTAI